MRWRSGCLVITEFRRRDRIGEGKDRLVKKIIKKYIEKALAKWAKRVIDRCQPEIIAITGSIGKTSAKEAIYFVLRKKFGKDVGRNAGNLNTEIGLPLAILGFSRTPKWWDWLYLVKWSWWRSFFHKVPKYLILEMAADKPGDIDYLTKIARPKVAVVLAVGPSHLAQFKTVEAVAEEKAKLVEALVPSGIAVLNMSDREVAKMKNLAPGKIVEFWAPGEHLAREAARTVGKIYEINDDDIEAALQEVEKLPGRMRIENGPKGSIIIDDSYNANPLSMAAALRVLARTAEEKNCRRKVAVLGEMLDLGDFSKEAHRQVMAEARKSADIVMGVGTGMKEVAPDEWFGSADEAAEALLKEIKEGDIILIKGSHGVHLEIVANKLKEKR